MDELKNKTDTDSDINKQAVDELIIYYRSTKKPILTEEIFELYETILNTKKLR
jgi:hypothetical protein